MADNYEDSKMFCHRSFLVNGLFMFCKFALFTFVCVGTTASVFSALNEKEKNMNLLCVVLT